MTQINNHINTAKETAENVTALFYQQKQQEGYQRLIGLIDELTIIVELLESKKNNLEIAEKYNKLLYSLKDIMEALVNRDSVLLADILNYDIIDTLDEIAAIIL